MRLIGRTRQSTWGKESLSTTIGDQKGGNPKRFNSGGPKDKRKQPAPWHNRTSCSICNQFHFGQCRNYPMRCFGCSKAGHKVGNYPKVEWNRGKSVQEAGPRNPQPAASQGWPLLVPQLSVIGTSTNPKMEAECTTWKLEKKKKPRIYTPWN